jgi:hypothetical protein
MCEEERCSDDDGFHALENVGYFWVTGNTFIPLWADIQEFILSIYTSAASGADSNTQLTAYFKVNNAWTSGKVLN